jgi:hypothetical protein
VQKQREQQREQQRQQEMQPRQKAATHNQLVDMTCRNVPCYQGITAMIHTIPCGLIRSNEDRDGVARLVEQDDHNAILDLKQVQGQIKQV